MLQLASQSPRRIDILHQFNIPFISIKNTLTEEPAYQKDPIKQNPIKHYVRSLAKQKGYYATSKTNDWILTADTIVVLNNHILGKPNSLKHATKMLNTLSGHTHNVITAIALTHPQTGHQISRSETTKITFSKLKNCDIEHYINKKKPLDKAGSYGIQEVPAHFISHKEGCYYNVMGLPIYTLLRLCKKHDILPT
jgi:septum formation protein